ncbi:MAG: tripartite tricarboxylate transporter substrate binding protein [Betaproteobacteria bacterium]|nr:tripartite tricarboxylate transporter substrate binding protein [Betaproteobacteria bacterium]
MGIANFRRPALGALLAAALSAAAQDYPAKPINMIVPFPPGGVADLTGRPTAIAMEKILRQPVLVVNRPGAGGAVGNAQVGKGATDGYTVLMALSSISVIPEAERSCKRAAPYDLNQFTPIALISADPTVLAVRSDSPYRSLRDLVDAAKQAPAKLSFSSSGIYGALHMPMAMFEAAAGIKLFHIPYSGGGPAVTALLGSQVELTAGGPSALIGQIRGGRLRPLASWGSSRLVSLPDVPTFKELGMEVEYFIWSGVFVAAGTPPAIVNTLRDAVRRAVQDADFKATMEKIQTPVAYLDAPEFARYWDADARRLAGVLKHLGCIEQQAGSPAPVK